MAVITLPYAKAGEVYHIDDQTISAWDLKVIDLATGDEPVDDRGRMLAFREVNAVEGWGIAYSNPRGDDVIRVEGRFEIRYAPDD